MTMKSKQITPLVEQNKPKDAIALGWELKEIRGEMNRLKGLNEKATALFKKACDDEKVTEAGGYRISKDPYGKIVVSIIEKAMEWAEDFPNSIEINTSIAHDIFRHTHTDPTKFGFAYETTVRVEEVKNVDKIPHPTHYVTIRRPNEKEV